MLLSCLIITSIFIVCAILINCALIVAQMVTNLPEMKETQVQSLDPEDSPGEGNSNPLQYSCLEDHMNRGAWRATAHGVTKSQTLSD